jgi:N-acetylglucosaminyl-diphospho-decaprenol L-rhamnosyltransferase
VHEDAAAPSRAATIIIATRNRLDLARRAVATSLAQEGDVEVLVLDDASTDGSADALQRELPEARVHRSERPLGAVGQRNLGARLARGRVLVSLDDDAELPSPRTIAQTLAAFDDERIGVVTLPLLQPAHGTDLFQAAPGATGTWCTYPYIAAGAAVRRDLWLAAGGFRHNDVPRANEEPELLLRLLDAGFVCRLGSADPAVHHEAADRDWDAILRHDFRNQVLHAWWYAPGRALPERVARIGAHGVLTGTRLRRPRPFVRGVADGLRAAAADRPAREPIAPAAWRAAMACSRRPTPLAELDVMLAPPSLDRLRRRAERLPGAAPG